MVNEQPFFMSAPKAAVAVAIKFIGNELVFPADGNHFKVSEIAGSALLWLKEIHFGNDMAVFINQSKMFC